MLFLMLKLNFLQMIQTYFYMTQACQIFTIEQL